jgi:N-acetylneuraminate synthase
MEAYLDVHINEDIYVICSGKSCDFIDKTFFDNKITIGINQVYKKFNCKYYMRKESKFTEQVIKSIDKNSKLFITKGNCGQGNNSNKIIIDKKFKNNKNIIVCDNHTNVMKNTNRIKPEHFCKKGEKINKLITTFSTITTGIHLAYYMGAKNIILVGHDCCLIDNESNFTNYHSKETIGISWKGDSQTRYNRFLSQIEQQTIDIKKILKTNFSVNTYSLNPFINYNLEGHTKSKSSKAPAPEPAPAPAPEPALTTTEALINQRSDVAKRGNVQIIAEIGINHNGDIELCKKLMMASKVSGAQYVKIQKRNPDVCVPEAQKNKMRDTPWGRMTYIEYKHRLEFNEEQIKELINYSKSINITFFASVWDKDSVDVMCKYTNIAKIPSALITDLELCAYARKKIPKLIISTGMSTEEQVEACISACNPDVIMHTNSTYPCPPSDLNMNYLLHLREKYPNKAIGYSGHEYGLVTTFAAVALGADWIERHITWDRTMWGSDQSSSVEIPGLIKLVKGCNDVVESTMYPPQDRIVFEGERAKMESLRPTK